MTQEKLELFQQTFAGPRKKVFFLIGGLGERPDETMSLLGKAIRSYGGAIYYSDSFGVVTHQNRVDKILRQIELYQDYDIFLIGSSAGGSAARIACEYEHKNVKGLILLSPAMPKGISFLSWALLRIMAKHFFQIIFGVGKIVPSREDYKKLISPLLLDDEERILSSLEPIPAKEAHELAFNPPGLRPILCPALLFFGDRDAWIKPQAHRDFSRVFYGCVPGNDFQWFSIPGAGHIVLSSGKREFVIQEIIFWSQKILARS